VQSQSAAAAATTAKSAAAKSAAAETEPATAEPATAEPATAKSATAGSERKTYCVDNELAQICVRQRIRFWYCRKALFVCEPELVFRRE